MIQSYQRGSLDVGVQQFTVPQGQISLSGMVSGNSEENRAKVWFRTGITPRLDVGAGYSRMGNRRILLFTWHPLSRKEGVPFDVLVGYGFTSSNVREEDGFYAFAVKGFGRLSLVTGFQRLRNGRNIGVLAGSYLLSSDLGLMFYNAIGTMPGEPAHHNLAIIRRIGEWQVGLWWFNPSREGTVGLSFTTQFSVAGR